ncbi:MAG: methyltransferase domain-containing protein [Desulforhopalus sp.]|nr:methyltransferase domain-containing protein [Desulforhopalus sp.]
MSIQDLSDRSSKTYDRDRRRLIPCYDDFYSIPLEIIPFLPDRELRILDLGAGTGLLSAAIAALYPRALLTLVDLAPEMLRVAEARFAPGDSGRLTFQVMDYGSEPLKGTYDLIISALSIHHLGGSKKRELFQKVHDALEPGGLFINADQVLGENAVAESICTRIWLQKVRASGITENALSEALERMRENHMSPLSSQLDWLEMAGFNDIITWYRYYNFVVYSGTKPLPA